MGLREDLMNRFAELGQIPNEEIVQEVIRQMAWSRLVVPTPDGFTRVSQMHLPDGTCRNVDVLELTLAPTDWRPE